jgi:hypothetical protein
MQNPETVVKSKSERNKMLENLNCLEVRSKDECTAGARPHSALG